MLSKLLELSLNNRLMVLLGAAFLSIVGVYTIRSMDVDVFPDLTAPTVTILTESHGLEAEEVEKQVSDRIEKGLNGSPGIRRLRSSSSAGISIVWAEFEWGTDIYRARQIVSEKIFMIKESLPRNIGEPAMAPVSSIMGEIMILAVSSDSLSDLELRSLADWEIRPRIKSIQGIANVIVTGGDYKQYQVLASPLKMDYYGVSLVELENALAKANLNASGGLYSQYGKQYVIQGEGRVYSTNDIEEVYIKHKGKAPVTISDVARVKIGGADKIGDGALNGQSAVIITITKQPQVNTLDLSEKLDEVLVDLKKSMPKGVGINQDVFRQADFIQASVNNLQQTLIEGAFFVAVVLLLFLMNWRTTIISLLAIPLSLVASFLVLEALGFTINTMSLGGMAIAIGALVDDAIIDVENVFKRLRENTQLPEKRHLSGLKIVFEASKEIRSSIIIATLIIIVSFIPLFFLGGMEGRLLQPLGIAFITSILSSLLIAVTVTPVLASYLLTNKKSLQKRSGKTWLEKALQSAYGFLLKQTLQRPMVSIVLVGIAFAISLWVASGLGRSFLPEFNEGSLVISVVGSPSMSLEESNQVGKRVENILLSMPEIEVTTRRTGRAELDEHAQGVNASEIDVPFTIDKRTKEDFLNDLREKLKEVQGVNITIGMPIAHRIDHMLSGTRANIAIKLFGTDLNKMYGISKQIKNEIEGIEGIVDVSVEQQLEVPKVKIKPKSTIMLQYGMSTWDLMKFVDVAFAGEVVSEVYEGKRRYDLVVRYDTNYRGSIDRIKNALVDVPTGGKVKLKNLATIHSVSTPNTINRENVERKVVVSANVSGRDLRGAVNEIRHQLDENIDLPSTYRLEYGGQFENEEKASQLLLISSIGAVVIIFLLLYLEFKNLQLAFIVLLNLPLALMGGVFIVKATTGIVSIASTIGFISLFGIATRNGILLISHYQSLKANHTSIDQLIIKGSKDRINPILMTALTTALALIPLAFKGNEAGNEIQSPMALVILGGLLSATLLNMFVIPSVYKLLYRKEHEKG